jgi:hypothetical protein
MIETMHKGHFAEHFEDSLLVRAEYAVAKNLVWSGLVACALAAAVYDVGRWFNFW